jgi:hypothetical protein
MATKKDQETNGMEEKAPKQIEVEPHELTRDKPESEMRIECDARLTNNPSFEMERKQI